MKYSKSLGFLVGCILPFCGVAQLAKLPWMLEVDSLIHTLSNSTEPAKAEMTDVEFWDLPESIQNQIQAKGFGYFLESSFNQDIELLQLSIFSNPFEAWDRSGSVFHLYYQNDKPLKVEETYINRSRMGSCGTIDIRHELYFQADTVVNICFTESPFSCYGDSPNTELMEELIRHFQSKRKRLAFENFLYKMEKFKAELSPENAFFTDISLDSIDIHSYDLVWIEDQYNQARRAQGNQPIFLFGSIHVLQKMGDEYIVIQIDQDYPPMSILLLSEKKIVLSKGLIPLFLQSNKRTNKGDAF
jgi:hypothetical protein